MSVDAENNMSPYAPSAPDLVSEWLNNVQRIETTSRQGVVDLLLRDLCVPTPSAFYDLLALPHYQIFKKRLMDRYYPSVLVFAWQKALQETQTTQADDLLKRLKASFLAKMPRAKPRLDIIIRHLALFAVVTDNFVEDGFMSVSHHIVLHILGQIEKNPGNLVSSVRLADYLDIRFKAYFDYLENRKIY